MFDLSEPIQSWSTQSVRLKLNLILNIYSDEIIRMMPIWSQFLWYSEGKVMKCPHRYVFKPTQSFAGQIHCFWQSDRSHQMLPQYGIRFPPCGMTSCILRSMESTKLLISSVVTIWISSILSPEWSCWTHHFNMADRLSIEFRSGDETRQSQMTVAIVLS
jgi:hypothetical protein